jgi:hypothetical protein
MARDLHFCRGQRKPRDVFLPEDKCVWCSPPKEPLLYDENGYLEPGQEGVNFWSRVTLDDDYEAGVNLKSNTGVRMASTRNFIEHCVHLLNKYRPVRGGQLTLDQKRTMRVINVMDEWNEHAGELLEDATKYGVVSLDTGE